MSWASRRRFYILSGVGAVIAAFLIVVLIATFYHVPSCSDNVQNQGEAGIDCGGPCPYLCTAQVEQPVVEFVRPLTPQPGRTDVIAYVENPNTTAAAYAAPYQIVLYGANSVIVATGSGTVDLPPKATVPIFIPDFFSGSQTVEHAFLTFDPSSIKWKTYSEQRVLPKTVSANLTNASTTPRIDAVIENDDVQPDFDVKLVATVFDAGGNAIGASQTLLQEIPPQGTAPAVFTWNNPFSAVVARVEVTPLTALPQ